METRRAEVMNKEDKIVSEKSCRDLEDDVCLDFLVRFTLSSPSSSPSLSLSLRLSTPPGQGSESLLPSFSNYLFKCKITRKSMNFT